MIQRPLTKDDHEQADWFSLLVGAILAAVVPTGAQESSPSPASYVIGSQDQLSITVFDEPDLTGKYRVDSDGTVSFPLLDRVRAAGRTLSDFQATITAMLANGFLRNPQVRVDDRSVQEPERLCQRRGALTGQDRR